MNETRPQSRKPFRAVVVGGSLGGLFAGTMLKSIGWEVNIYERSENDLDSRGGGIVLQPDVVNAFGRVGVKTDDLDLGVPSRNRIVLSPNGSVDSNQYAPQVQTSWSLIYRTLREVFGDDSYFQGKTLVDINTEQPNAVTAQFADGTTATGDLLVGADGGSSTVRSKLWLGAEPTYARYLAWRGLVPEDEMSASSRQHLHGHFGFANSRQSHMLGYLVPGDNNDTRAGHRYYNWVWYRTADQQQLAEIMTDSNGRQRGHSIPEGLLSRYWHEHVYREAEKILPTPFTEIVHATRKPFAQAIRDLGVDRMVKGRVVLLGDAAFIPRPHTAASTSKAAANALELADALEGKSDHELPSALAAWEQSQLQLGRYLYVQGVRTGNHLMFPHTPPGSENS